MFLSNSMPQQRVEYDSTNALMPAAYQHTGYGAKVRYEGAYYYLGMSMLGPKTICVP